MNSRWPFQKRVNRIELLALFLFSTTLLNQSYGDTVTVTASADSGIEQFSPNSNFGNSVSAVSGKLGTSSNGEIRRGLFKFDLSGKIPAGATVNSVTLQVEVARVPTSPANSIFDLRRVFQDWSESGVTWNSRLSPNSPWQVPGATGAPDSQGTASSSVFVSDLGSYLFPSTPGLVSDVQAWVDNPAVNFGWLLISEDEVSSRTARHFATRESSFGVPVLTIDFGFSAPVILTQPQSQTVPQGSDGVVFSVTASGAGPLTFQWQLNGNDLSNATNSILVLDDVQFTNQGTYTVVVSNTGGSTTSEPATLTVQATFFPPPDVSFITPTNGQNFSAQSDIFVSAFASANSGTITQLEFFLDTNSVAVLTNSPFSIVVSNLPPGTHQLSARATDSNGASNTALILISGFAPPTINIPSPVSGTKFLLGTNIPLQAAVAGTAANISQVALFADDVELTHFSAPPYTFNWLPTEARDYILTAVAHDGFGQTGTSAPVSVRVYLPDDLAPTVKILTAPPNRSFSPSVFLTGAASDNVGLDRVEVQVNDLPFQPAFGTTSWSIPLALDAGLNTVKVRSLDLAGNQSVVITRFFTYVVAVPLAVMTDPPGQGTITPDLNGQPLEIGQLYSLTAKPNADQIFAGWSGAPSQGPALNFIMRSNLVLTAHFIPNRFPTVQGRYSGLMLNTNAPTPESTGSFRMQVKSSGLFSGELVAQGKRYLLRGQFNTNGVAQFAVLRPSFLPIALNLSLDITNGTGTVQGTASDGVWTSALLANRNIFDARFNPAPLAGIYSFLLQSTNAPPNLGAVATAKIKTNGGASFRGRLYDASPFSLATTMGADRNVPFYLSIRNGSEMMAGWIQFKASAPLLSGKIYWVRTGPDHFESELKASSLP